jgi:hypothetical protein
MAAKLNPSKLPGSHRNRVFVGGSYAAGNRKMLDELEKVIKKVGVCPDCRGSISFDAAGSRYT